VGEKKGFLLRIDETLLGQIQRWAADDLRSLNGQIEFLLKRAMEQSGRESKKPIEVKGRGATANHIKQKE
jgi:hypothetical protein